MFSCWKRLCFGWLDEFIFWRKKSNKECNEFTSAISKDAIVAINVPLTDSLFWDLFGTSWTWWLAVSLAKFVGEICGALLFPLGLKYFIDGLRQLSSHAEETLKIRLLGLALMVAGPVLLGSITNNFYFWMASKRGQQIRTGLMTRIFEAHHRKPRKVDEAAQQGRILDVAIIDTERLEGLCGFWHWAWNAPLAVFLSIWSIRLVGGSWFVALIGIAVLLLFGLGSQVVTNWPIQRRRQLASTWTDKRVQRCSEWFRWKQVVHLLGLDDYFAGMIREARYHEMKHLKVLHQLRSFSSSLSLAAPILAGMASALVVQSDVGGVGLVLPLMAAFGHLRVAAVMLPQMMAMWAEARVSWTRIRSFLSCKDNTLCGVQIDQPIMENCESWPNYCTLDHPKCFESPSTLNIVEAKTSST